MRNPLKRLAQRGTPKLTMRERATLLKASAARVIRRRPAVHPTDQPSGETLLANTVLDRGDDGFRSEKLLSHQRGEGAAEGTTRDGAGKNGASRSEIDMGRHETFDTALPLVEGLLDAGEIAMVEFARLHSSATEDGGGEDDAAKIIIARHKEAFAIARPVLDRWSDTVPNTAAWDAAEAAMRAPNEIEAEAFDVLLDTDASTLSGLLALADYLPGAVRADGIDADMCAVPMRALETICRNLQWLARQGRILPHACTLPASPPTPFAPVNLAAACDWAVQHIDWMNAGVEREDWTDEQSEEEWKKSDDVWTRALAEPALDLITLAAKARMLRHDWLNEHARAETDGDGRVRMALRVLNDTISIASSPASSNAAAGRYDVGVELAQAVRAYFASEPETFLDADHKLWSLAGAVIEKSDRGATPGIVVEPSDLVEAIQNEWLTFAALSSDDPDDAFDDCTRRRFDLIEAADRLPATRDNLIPKALSLAWLDFVEHERPGQPRNKYSIDGRLALDINTIMAAGQPAEIAAELDPILAAIIASRAAEATMAGWQDSHSSGKRRRKLTEADFAEEQRLCGLQRQTRDAAFETVPTTHVGRLALVDYIRFVQGLYGIDPDENPSLDDAHVWKQTHAALMAAVVAPVGASPPAAKPNFSSFTLRQLGGAHETIKNLWLHASGELQAPWCWDAGHDDTNAAGDFLDAESERLAHLLDVIKNEAALRSPTNAEERNQILSIRLLHAISGCGGIEDQKLMADVAKAWAA